MQNIIAKATPTPAQIPPLLQSFPDQPALQTHVLGAVQFPFTHPPLQMADEQSGFDHPSLQTQ